MSGEHKSGITWNRPPCSERPEIGQLITVRGQQCRIFKVYSFGTVDVESIDGQHAWRVTGLAFL